MSSRIASVGYSSLTVSRPRAEEGESIKMKRQAQALRRGKKYSSSAERPSERCRRELLVRPVVWYNHSSVRRLKAQSKRRRLTLKRRVIEVPAATLQVQVTAPAVADSMVVRAAEPTSPEGMTCVRRVEVSSRRLTGGAERFGERRGAGSHQ